MSIKRIPLLEEKAQMADELYFEIEELQDEFFIFANNVINFSMENKLTEEQWDLVNAIEDIKNLMNMNLTVKLCDNLEIEKLQFLKKEHIKILEKYTTLARYKLSVGF